MGEAALVIESWNPPYELIIQERMRTLQKLRANPKLLTAAKIHYKNNPVDFINDWAWTYDPRSIDENALRWMPMVMWPRQEDFIHWLHKMYKEQKNGLVEKNRGAGATWLAVWFSIWLFTFHKGSKSGWGSRKEALVDKLGDPDSIFEKIRMGMARLPGEFLPTTSWNVEKDTSFMKVLHPDKDNGAAITGEAGDNIGRGGRNSIYLVDESAFLERPQKVEASLSENTNCRIDISTVNGPGNPFHRKRFAYPSDRVFIFDWRDDPRKDDAWYAKQEAELDPITLAQEVDRDYEAAAENIVIPGKWVRAAVGLGLTPVGPRVIGLDVADEGQDKNAVVIKQGTVVQHFEDWKLGTTTETAQKAVLIGTEHFGDIIHYDSIGVGAGVKGELKRLKTRFDITGVSASAAPTKGYHIKPEGKDRGKKNKDMFRNLKAQVWWEVRRRFQRTYEHVNGIRQYDLEELISLPKECRELIAELSSQKYELTENGLIKIVSKKKLAAEGIKSPNLADALILAFAPQTKSKRYAW